MSDYPIHPAAEVFPPMSGEEFDGLVADIRKHGQREPIILFAGSILDGRNRYRACQQLGIEPLTVEWGGEGTIEAFVVSKNLHRRHLNESQRAMVAERLATLKKGYVASQCSDPVGKYGGGEISPPSRAAAGRLLNIHPTTIGFARTVIRQGTAEEVAAIEKGEASVSTVAKMIRAGASPEERRPALVARPVGVNGRRLPQKAIAERMSRALDQLHNTAEILGEFLQSHEAEGHPETAAWIASMRQARSLLSTTINQFEKRVA